MCLSYNCLPLCGLFDTSMCFPSKSCNCSGLHLKLSGVGLGVCSLHLRSPNMHVRTSYEVDWSLSAILNTRECQLGGRALPVLKGYNDNFVCHIHWIAFSDSRKFLHAWYCQTGLALVSSLGRDIKLICFCFCILSIFICSCYSFVSPDKSGSISSFSLPSLFAPPGGPLL